MKLMLFVLALICCCGFAVSEGTTECKWCFKDLACDVATAGNPGDRCWNCIRAVCESSFTLRNLASSGVSCIEDTWQSEEHCKATCPVFQQTHAEQLVKFKNCLEPCIAYAVENGIGQCPPEVPPPPAGAIEQCTPTEVTEPCGSCYRANRCYTDTELDALGACGTFLRTTCPGRFNETCYTLAWENPSSACPELDREARVRLQSCGLCIDTCDEMSACLKNCEGFLPTFPIGVPCPLCRALCAGTSDPEKCVRDKCECYTCDQCVKQCEATHGTSFFNLLNPCVCLERAAPLANIDGQRVIGGQTACEGDWPFMVYLFIEGSNIFDGFICGGALISNQWVLTAAHCIETVNPLLYGVVLGEHDRSVTSGNEQIFNVSEIKIHDSYNPLTFNNDIALLKLSRPAIINKHVMPINVVTSGTRTDPDIAPTFAGKTCILLGWGKTSSPGGSTAISLMQLGANIMPRSLCLFLTLQHSGDYQSRAVGNSEAKFCAGGLLGEDSCGGDSGGPLVCLHDNNQYYLHGLVSYGSDICAELNKPGVYAKLADLRGWIDSNTTH